MSDHLIAEANRHARALIIERDQIRTELALLREWQREVIQNANAHHAERKDAIARAESAEREAFDWKKIARYETARAERAEDNLAALEQCHDDNCRGVVQIADELATAKERLRSEAMDDYAAIKDLQRELAAERARLDSGQILLTVAGERVWHCGVDLRAAIDAGMREGAK